MSRSRAVARERVEHPRSRRYRRHAAVELCADGDEQHHLRRGRPERVDEHLLHRERPGAGGRVDLLDRERDAEREDVAEDRRDDDRHDHAARRRSRGVLGLLAHVRGGVVARVGVLRLQQSEQEHEPQPRVREAAVVDRLREDRPE